MHFLHSLHNCSYDIWQFRLTAYLYFDTPYSKVSSLGSRVCRHTEWYLCCCSYFSSFVLALLISLRGCSDICKVLVRLVDNSDTCSGKQQRRCWYSDGLASQTTLWTEGLRFFFRFLGNLGDNADSLLRRSVFR